VALIQFISSDKIETVHDFSTNNETLVNRLSLFRPEDGQSAIVDALFLGAGHLQKYKAEEDRRKVLVVITDGEDRNSYYKKEDLLKRLRETRVQVFALAITTKLDNESGFIRTNPRERAEKFLRSIVNETGGRLLFSKTPRELGEATEEVLRNLNRSFLIIYRSTETRGKKGFHKVDVTLISDLKQKPIAAQGYFAPDKDLSNKKQ
jgi:Ca-activated chloride channel family protein